MIATATRTRPSKKEEKLSKRWTELRYHPIQHAYANSKTRFNVVPAGRRSGKTEYAKRRLCLRAIEFAGYTDGRFICAAPTYTQAREIFWDDLKRMMPSSLLRKRPKETDLTLYLINGVKIQVMGMDKAYRAEGPPLDGIVLDEYANMRPEVWTKHIRPALDTDGRPGWADFIGVPEGRNHYYDLNNSAIADETGQWSAFTWPSSDILSPEIIEQWKHDLDELTFDQEANASFITFEGRAYFGYFTDTHGCKGLAKVYDNRAPLLMCFDFNRAPGVAVVAQEMRKSTIPAFKNFEDLDELFTGVIGEVHIPQNSNTPLVANRLLRDWGEHLGPVLLHGDATGGAKTSSSVEGSDWDLVKQVLKPKFGNRLRSMFPRANPAERSRVNAMNSRFRSVDGSIKLLVDHAAAPNLVRDLEGVTTVKGGSGELDKAVDLRLTHPSDGLGYYVVEKFPVSGGHKMSVTHY